jgi:methionine-gamma-lyase
MDSMRSASVMKTYVLHLRIQHSHNAAYLAERFEKTETVYPGLKSHPSHDLFASMINPEYGFGGMMTLDIGSLAKCFNELMQSRRIPSREFRILQNIVQRSRNLYFERFL